MRLPLGKLVVCWLLGTGWALAQEPGMDSPIAPRATGFFATNYGNASSGLFYVRDEALMWWIQSTPLPSLVTSSPPGTPVTQAGENLDAVVLEPLTRASPVARLASTEVVIDRVPIENEPGGKTAEDRDERGPVRLPRRCQP